MHAFCVRKKARPFVRPLNLVLCEQLDMAFSELEHKKYERVVKAYVERHRPPAYLRSKVDLSFRIKGQSVELFEIRPLWNDPGRKIEEAIAKATYVKARRTWKVYWQRADLKWHCYDPDAEVPTLEKFIEVVERDEYGCFRG